MHGWVVDLDKVSDDCDAVETLRLLVEMHGETHRVWQVTPSAGGAWDYVKVYRDA
jgi:hypothetical protein